MIEMLIFKCDCISRTRQARLLQLPEMVNQLREAFKKKAEQKVKTVLSPFIPPLPPYKVKKVQGGGYKDQF